MSFMPETLTDVSRMNFVLSDKLKLVLNECKRMRERTEHVLGMIYYVQDCENH